LRDSIKSDRPQSLGGTAVRGTVMPKAVYARIQELGGVAGRGSHLPARPYMRPAHQRVMEVLNRIAVEEWNKL
jgi:phage gpG-like protein